MDSYFLINLNQKGGAQKMKDYGKELILDLHGCNIKSFNRKTIKKFFRELCKEIKMTRCDLHFWDDLDVPTDEKQTSPHTKGISAVQFILTSNITIHTLDLLGNIYINIFSCKNFNVRDAESVCRRFFKGKIVNKQVIRRI